jgi:hypothetical protein
MDREIPFDENAICDGCGCKGAFDFMGDFYCEKCSSEAINNQCECNEDCECNLDYTDEINE